MCLFSRLPPSAGLVCTLATTTRPLRPPSLCVGDPVTTTSTKKSRKTFKGGVLGRTTYFHRGEVTGFSGTQRPKGGALRTRARPRRSPRSLARYTGHLLSSPPSACGPRTCFYLVGPCPQTTTYYQPPPSGESSAAAERLPTSSARGGYSRRPKYYYYLLI